MTANPSTWELACVLAGPYACVRLWCNKLLHRLGWRHLACIRNLSSQYPSKSDPAEISSRPRIILLRRRPWLNGSTSQHTWICIGDLLPRLITARLHSNWFNFELKSCGRWICSLRLHDMDAINVDTYKLVMLRVGRLVNFIMAWVLYVE